MGSRVRALGGGRLLVTLTREEADVLRGLPEELGTLLDQLTDSLPDDPVHQRLFPLAYTDPTEEKSEAEWQAMVRPELVSGRRAALRLVSDTLERVEERGRRLRVTLEPEEADAWLGVLNDTRLALGVRLEVDEGGGFRRVDRSHPRAPAIALYDWLTWIQSDLVDALAGRMP
jgi:hypothetical protein